MAEKEVQRRRRKWRRKTKIWVVSTLTIVSALIYWEQAAALYVLSTLAMTVLLFLVAIANLEGKEK